MDHHSERNADNRKRNHNFQQCKTSAPVSVIGRSIRAKNIELFHGV
jgi:hypothetical protein